MHHHAADVIVGHFGQHLGFADMGILDDVSSVIDGSRGSLDPDEGRHDLVAVASRDPLPDIVIQQVDVLSAAASRAEPGFVDDLWMADQTQDPLGYLLGARRDSHPPVVPGPIDVAGRVVGRAVAVPSLDDPRVVIDAWSWSDGGHDRLENAHVYDLTGSPAYLPVAQCHQNSRHARDPTDAVGQAERGQGGRPAGLPGHVREATHRLGEGAEAGPCGIWTLLAKAGKAQQHETRVDLLETLRSDAPPLEGAGPEVLDDHISPLSQTDEHFGAFRVAEVDCNGSLVARDLLPPKGDPVKLNPVTAQVVAGDGMLDLDDVGSEVTEDLAAQRPGKDGRSVDHPHSSQALGCIHRRDCSIRGSSAIRKGIGLAYQRIKAPAETPTPCKFGARPVRRRALKMQRPYRSYLYVPGFEGRRIEKALQSEADAVILDLEDAVPPDRKTEAREVAAAMVREALPKPVFVRINTLASGLAEGDIAAMVGPGLTGVRLPKAESSAGIRQVAWWLSRATTHQPVALVPLVESALGVERAWELAAASPAVTALAMGEADLRADLGVTADDGLIYARSRCVNAARAAGIVAIQSVFPDIRDMDGLRSSTERGRALGFLGRSAIHPSQVAVINEAMTPSDDECRRAEEVLAAYEKSRRAGLGAMVTAAGHFVDDAVVRSARVTLALARGPASPGSQVTGSA